MKGDLTFWNLYNYLDSLLQGYYVYQIEDLWALWAAILGTSLLVLRIARPVNVICSECGKEFYHSKPEEKYAFCSACQQVRGIYRPQDRPRWIKRGPDYDGYPEPVKNYLQRGKND